MNRETTVARQQVEDAEVAIKQEQDDTSYAEKTELTVAKPKTTSVEMLNTIGESLSTLPSPDDGEDWEEVDDDNEDPQLDKHSEDDEPGWVMDTISKTVQHLLEHFRQKQIKLDELTQPGWGDKAN